MELIIKKLEEENKQLRMSLDDCKSANKRIKKEAKHNDYNKLQRRFYSKCQENENLCEALKFYAEECNYDSPIYDEYGQYNGSLVDKDEGEVARKALNER